MKLIKVSPHKKQIILVNGLQDLSMGRGHTCDENDFIGFSIVFESDSMINERNGKIH